MVEKKRIPLVKKVESVKKCKKEKTTCGIKSNQEFIPQILEKNSEIAKIVEQILILNPRWTWLPEAVFLTL